MPNPVPQLAAATVLSREFRAPGFWCVRLRCEYIGQLVRAAQYVAIDLPGPFSVRLPLGVYTASEIGFSVLFQEWGERTKRLAALAKNDTITCIGPLGNEFTLPAKGTRAVIVAGGLGVAAFWLLARALRDADIDTTIVLGARTKELLVGQTDLSQFGFPIEICTDDGSAGFRGTVVDRIKQLHDVGILYGCGPRGMLRALCEYASTKGIECQVSMEETFGCSMGTCWGCVVPVRRGSKQGTGYPKASGDPRDFDFARVCADGTVFSGTDLLWR